MSTLIWSTGLEGFETKEFWAVLFLYAEINWGIDVL